MASRKEEEVLRKQQNKLDKKKQKEALKEVSGGMNKKQRKKFIKEGLAATPSFQVSQRHLKLTRVVTVVLGKWYQREC